MAHDVIKEVVWKHPTINEPGFGFKRNKIDNGDNFITCIDRSPKSKEFYYEGEYHFDGEMALKQPTMIRKGVKLAMIPFTKCKKIVKE